MARELFGLESAVLLEPAADGFGTGREAAAVRAAATRLAAAGAAANVAGFFATADVAAVATGLADDARAANGFVAAVVDAAVRVEGTFGAVDALAVLARGLLDDAVAPGAAATAAAALVVVGFAEEVLATRGMAGRTEGALAELTVFDVGLAVDRALAVVVVAGVFAAFVLLAAVAAAVEAVF